MPTHEVVIKEIPAQPVAAVRDTVPEYSHFGQLLGEVFGHLGQHQISPAGPPVGIYYDEEFRERDVDVEAAVPVSGAVPEGERVKWRQLPPVEKMACVIHEGAFDETFSATYGQLLAWIEANGYRMAGPCREVYVQWDPGGDPTNNITEVQVPVERV